MLQSVLVAFFPIPIHLATHTPDNLDLLGPELHAGKKVAQVVHEIIRIIRINEADAHQHVFELVIHGFKLMLVGQARNKFTGFIQAEAKQLIAHDHNRLGQVEG